MTAFTRRRALFAGGTVGLGALLAACTSAAPPSDGPATMQPVTESAGDAKDLLDQSGTCALTPEETEGPYYFDVDSVRSDIREDRPGVRLRLALRVQDLPGCTPVSNAVVEIWHCDAGGLYSGFEAASQGQGSRRDDETYLRGAQVTNADGIVEFVTVYPGWYRGRTVHIHFKVHITNKTVLTSQLFFDEKINEAVYQREPYSANTGRDRFNDNDGIFDASLVTNAVADGDGYLAVLNIGVDAA